MASDRFLKDVHEALEAIEYKNWSFMVSITNLYLRVEFFDEDGKRWTGRKWKLSEHMTKSEIVQTALKAVLTAEEHEARERFLYRGKPIFGPHIDVDSLHSVCGNLDARK